MGVLRRLGLLPGFALLVAGLADGARAEEPRDWQLGFQPAASPTMERVSEFHDLLLVIITVITAFVLILLLYVMVRFSEKRNPTPSKTTHNTVLEVLWTTIPVIILVIVAIPSFKLLYYADRVENADMTLKAIGRQWYWSYEYPDNGNFTFDATLVAEEDLEPGQLRLLETDNYVVLPVNTKIRILVTASDVLHSFAVPAFGIKLDAVPGRINETWVEITREGTYYGQCSEICGTGHAYMPIAIKAVSKREFDSWVEKAKEEFARVDESDAGARLAQGPRAP
ncbi:MAG: cytochrome c oxidase subunit II [Kiloniellaceae bacterium]